MKSLITLLFTILSFTAYSQFQDTVFVGEKIIAGEMKLYDDRVIVDDGIYEWMVMRHLITGVKTRSVIFVNNTKTYSYTTDINALNFAKAPVFQDMRYHLRNAGTYGIISTSLMIAGGIVTGLGAYVKDPTTTYVGTTIGIGGSVLLFPTFIHLVKAGKVKSYKLP